MNTLEWHSLGCKINVRIRFCQQTIECIVVIGHITQRNFNKI